MISLVNKEDVAQGRKGKPYVRSDPIKNEYEDLLMTSVLHDIGKYGSRIQKT